jgi:hypothetical protein
MSATLVHSVVFLARANLSHATGSRPAWQTRAQGHANRMTLFPLRRAHATAREPSDASHVSPPPDHRPPLEPLELGYKSLASDALALISPPAATGGQPLRTKE